MNGKVTNFTHPVETAEDASQSDFNLFVSPKEARFLTGERKEKPGFRGSWGFPSSLHPSPTHKQAIQGDSGVGPRGLGRHLQTVSAAGPSGEFARTPRRGRPLGAPRQRRRPTGSAQGRVHSAPGPAAEPKAASDLAEGLAPPGRRLHLPSSSPGHAGLPCRPPDTHRPALPNLGPGPGCRGRRARLLRAVPEPLRAPHPRAVRLLIARLPAGEPPFLSSSPPPPTPETRPPPQAAAPLGRPAPLLCAPPTWPDLAWEAVAAAAAAASLAEARTLSPAGTRPLGLSGTRTSRSAGARTLPNGILTDRVWESVWRPLAWERLAGGSHWQLGGSSGQSASSSWSGVESRIPVILELGKQAQVEWIIYPPEV